MTARPQRAAGALTGLVVMAWLAFLLAAVPPADAQVSCVELIQNGGFETDGAWILGADPVPPQYVTYAYHTPNRSLALGIVQGANQYTFSSARQTVTLPATADQAQLSFWVYPKFVNSVPATDWVQLFLLFPNAMKVPLWDSYHAGQVWIQLKFDLSQYRGQTFDVYFNVYNDGVGGTAGMFIDDVSLLACSGLIPSPVGTATPAPAASWTPTPSLPVWTATSTVTPTPTPGPIVATPTFTPYYVTPTPGPIVATPTFTPYYVTPTATPPPLITPTATPLPPWPTVTPWPATPWPPNCIDLIANGGFDVGWAGWHPSANRLPVQLVSGPVLSWPYALRHGTQDQNVRSYSSVRQYVTLPAHATAVLQFWVYTWAEPFAWDDRQEAILLSADNAVLAVLWRGLWSDGYWRQVAVDLSRYAGRTVAVYFNVYNDGRGGRTAMFLDNVQLLACRPQAPPPGPITAAPPILLGPPQVLPELVELPDLTGTPELLVLPPSEGPASYTATPGLPVLPAGSGPAGSTATMVPPALPPPSGPLGGTAPPAGLPALSGSSQLTATPAPLMPPAESGATAPTAAAGSPAWPPTTGEAGSSTLPEPIALPAGSSAEVEPVSGTGSNAALFVTPAMTRVALAMTPAASPTPLLIADTPTPTPTATPSTPFLSRVWGGALQGSSPLALLLGVLLLALVVFLFVWYIWPGVHRRGRLPQRPPSRLGR